MSHPPVAWVQVEQQIAPVLRALTGAIGEADQFLAAFRRCADQDQDALLLVLEACLEMEVDDDVVVNQSFQRLCDADDRFSQPSIDCSRFVS
jgi:hypothetical protein